MDAPESAIDPAPAVQPAATVVPPRMRHRHIGVSVALGVVVALVVVAAGYLVIAGSGKKWSAKATVVVLPDPSIGVSSSASYYDTLSHGQITSTIANLLDLAQFKTAAGQALGLDPATLSAVTVKADAITGTALVTVTTTGPTRQVASAMADQVISQATPTVNSLASPYLMSVVSRTNGTATQSTSLSLGKFLVVLVVVAVALGVGVQQAVMQLATLTWRRRARRAGSEPAPAAAGPPPGDRPSPGDGPQANGHHGRPAEVGGGEPSVLPEASYADAGREA